MRNLIRRLTAGLVALTFLSFSQNPVGYLAKNSWDRYQIILDKDPFGKLGPADPLETPDWAKDIRVSYIVRRGSDLFAGWVSSKTNSFSLKLGEISEEGITLESINYEDESIKLSKAGKYVTLNVQALPYVTNAFPIASSTRDTWREFYARTQQVGQQRIPTHIHVTNSVDKTVSRVDLTPEQQEQIRQRIIQQR